MSGLLVRLIDLYSNCMYLCLFIVLNKYSFYNEYTLMFVPIFHEQPNSYPSHRNIISKPFLPITNYGFYFQWQREVKTDKNLKENLKVLPCKREHIHLRRTTRDVPRSSAFPQSPVSGNRWPNKRSKDFLRSGSSLEPVREPLRSSADEESCKHSPRHSRPRPAPTVLGRCSSASDND